MPQWSTANVVLNCQRGYITYDQLFTKEERTFEPRTWSCRQAMPVGFKKVIWWPFTTAGVDRLVILMYSGELIVLECRGLAMHKRENWVHRQDMIAISGEVHGMAVEGDKLIIFTVEGRILWINENGEVVQSRKIALLRQGELVSSFGALTADKFVSVTSHGRVIESWLDEDKILADDQILMPGPLLVEGEHAMFVTKFNHIYRLSSSNSFLEKEYKISLPTDTSSIAVLIPESKDKFLIATCSGQWYNLVSSNHSQTIVPLCNPPWREKTFRSISSKFIDDEDGDGVEERGESDSEAEEENQDILEDSTISGSRTSINGFCGADGLWWILESEHRPYPEPHRMHLRLLRLSKDPSSHIANSRSFFAAGPSGQIDLEKSVDHHYILGACQECNLVLIHSATDSNIAICGNGHFFGISSITGKVINDQSQMVRCFHCKRMAPRESQLERCPCGIGSLLPVSMS